MIDELFAYLCVNDANAAIDYDTKGFGASEKFRLTEPGGRIGHAELDFDGITLMLSDDSAAAQHCCRPASLRSRTSGPHVPAGAAPAPCPSRRPGSRPRRRSLRAVGPRPGTRQPR